MHVPRARQNAFSALSSQAVETPVGTFLCNCKLSHSTLDGILQNASHGIPEASNENECFTYEDVVKEP